jgi:hypothetical protein
MGKGFASVALFGLLLCGRGWSQQADVVSARLAAQPAPQGAFSLKISGSMYVPVAEAARSFGMGAGEDLTLGYQIPGTMFFGFGGISYTFAPAQLAAPTVFFAAAELGFGMRFRITSHVDVRVYGTAGYWYGAYSDMSTSSTDPYAGAGVELQLALTPALGLGVDAQYKNYFGLWQGLAAGFGMRIALESGER